MTATAPTHTVVPLATSPSFGYLRLSNDHLIMKDTLSLSSLRKFLEV